MKLPRWLLRALIVGTTCATSTFAAWWWITWPARTMQDFTWLVQQGRFHEANRLLQLPSRWEVEQVDGRNEVRFESGSQARAFRFTAETWQTWCTRDNLQAEPRSLWDVLQSEQRFSFHREFTTPFFIGGYAKRGTVVMRCEPWAVPAF